MRHLQSGRQRPDGLKDASMLVALSTCSHARWMEEDGGHGGHDRDLAVKVVFLERLDLRAERCELAAHQGELGVTRCASRRLVEQRLV